MEILLNKSICRSFTGALSKKDGYCIRRRGERFFGCRQLTRQATPDGHWRFIVTCAQIARHRLYVSNIIVSYEEVRQALEEAGKTIPPMLLADGVFNAEKLLAFKNEYSL